MYLHRRPALMALCAMLTGAVFLSCAPVPACGQSPSNLAALKSLFHRPDSIPFPADNPFTQTAALLGRTLFFDARLSGSGSLACANCHNPSFGWEDGLPVGHGAGLRDLGRHSPTILNAAWGKRFFWDGRAATLEQQASGPIANPREMAGDLAKLPDRIKNIAGYAPLFARAYPGQGITMDTITKAIAVFERSVASFPAPFDAWLDGQEDAMSDSAKRGFILFTGKAGCAACHTGWAFTDGKFHDIGMHSDDLGRIAIAPAEPEADHAFKTPTLRDVARRAPYMHDGSLHDLPSVVAHYMVNSMDRPSRSKLMSQFALSSGETADLIAFLQALSEPARSFPTPTLPQ